MSLRVEQLDLNRAGKPVLRNVSLHLQPGCVHAVLGANGAGKSSLLHVMAGDLNPSSGRAWLGEQPLADIDATSLAKQRAVLAQSSHLDFAFSVQEQVGLGRYPYNGSESAAQRDDAVGWALAQCELDDLVTHPVTQLSGGQQRRAHIARVLAQLYPLPADSPRYLLLDEPTASLDLRHALAFLQRLRTLAKRGLGVLWISHDINLAARFADDVTLLADGQVIAQGAPAAVMNEDSLARCYQTALTAVDAGGQRLWMPASIDAT